MKCGFLWGGGGGVLKQVCTCHIKCRPNEECGFLVVGTDVKSHLVVETKTASQ